MTLLRAIAAVALLLFALSPVRAEDVVPPPDPQLDALFAQLRQAPDEQAAHQIDQKIWDYWTSPKDPALASRMQEVLVARTMYDYQGAMRLLDELVVDFPNYAEGWNQRATLYYLLNDYDASLADIDKVLALEPRHFGARAGRVLILLSQGKRAEALREMERALAIHPFLSERQFFPELQQDMVHV